MAGSISLITKPPISIANKLLLSSPSPPLKPFKLPKRRRNSLRPKILTKPYSQPRNPISVTPVPEVLAPPADQDSASAVVVPAESGGLPVVVSGRNLARYGLYLVGVFVFQTVFAVWILGSSGSGSKTKDESLDGKGMVLLDENRNRDEIELGEKVEEIRVLARRARMNERTKNGGSGNESKSGAVEREVGNRLLGLKKRLESGREKLPGSYVNRLSKVDSVSEAKTGNEGLVFKKKFRVRSATVGLGESPKGFGGSENEEIGDERLSLTPNPKGFVGSEESEKSEEETVECEGIDLRNDPEKMTGPEGFGGLETNKRTIEEMSESGGIDSVALNLTQNGQKKSVGLKGFGGSEKNGKSVGKIVESEKMSLPRNGRKKLESPKGFGGSEKSKALRGKESRKKAVVNGSVGDEAMEGIQKAKLVQNGRKKSEGKETRREGVIQESRDKGASAELPESETPRDSIVEDSSELSILSRNKSSRLNEAEKKPESRKVPDKISKISTDIWWLDLPYVLVILMQRAADPSKLTGLYTLTIEPDARDQDELSYTVAFEDRVDATNFCFLLESHFEDLGDVSADIIPMSVKAVQTAINSEEWNVIVVKKGQLKLYAGQPFEEVEMALRALV